MDSIIQANMIECSPEEHPRPDFRRDTCFELNGEWQFIERDYNHPCIIAWVPINESWGFQQIKTDGNQQAAVRMLYQLTKAFDGTRLCSSNDGWEQVETDVMQEVNGLMTPERKPKVDVERFARLNQNAPGRTNQCLS